MLIIHYRFKIYDFTGEWTWASTYVGNSINAIVLIGMIFMGAGAAYPFGVFDNFSASGNIIIDKTNSSK